MKNKKYVVLEHLTLPNRGFRFWSTNTPGNNTKLLDGSVVYKEVLFTDSTDEAIEVSRKPNAEAIPTFKELSEYHYDVQKIEIAARIGDTDKK